MVSGFFPCDNFPATLQLDYGLTERFAFFGSDAKSPGKLRLVGRAVVWLKNQFPKLLDEKVFQAEKKLSKSLDVDLDHVLTLYCRCSDCFSCN
jgi:hypothetical protein